MSEPQIRRITVEEQAMERQTMIQEILDLTKKQLDTATNFEIEELLAMARTESQE